MAAVDPIVTKAHIEKQRILVGTLNYIFGRFLTYVSTPVYIVNVLVYWVADTNDLK